MSNIHNPKSGRTSAMRLGAGLLALAGMLSVGGVVHAQARLTDAEARQIAVARVPGTAVHVEREVEHGRRIVEVHVRDAAGRIMGVEIDEVTRAIVTVEQEEADEQGEHERGSEHHESVEVPARSH